MDMKTLTQQHQDCLNACFSCAKICHACADDMIGMKRHDHDDLMTQCIRLCHDCADLCFLMIKFVSRNSLRSEGLSRLCAEICDECAEVCERHTPHHALCGPCAEECRRCADICREMIGTGVHAAYH
jgi:hypothetical protein